MTRKPQPAVKVVYLIRHGQYAHDPERLTDLGRAQASLLAPRFEGYTIDAITSSTLPRAIQTATILSEALGKRFRKRRDLVEMLPTELPRKPLPAGTPPLELTTAEQLDSAADWLLQPAKKLRREVVVCHGNILRALTCRALDLPQSVWFDFAVHHCGVTSLTIMADGQCKLGGLNDIGHLPRKLRTTA